METLAILIGCSVIMGVIAASHGQSVYRVEKKLKKLEADFYDQYVEIKRLRSDLLEALEYAEGTIDRCRELGGKSATNGSQTIVNHKGEASVTRPAESYGINIRRKVTP